MENSNWRTVKLGEHASFVTGKLDSNAATPDGAYPFFTCSRETFRTDTFSFDTECVLLAGNNAAGIFPLKYFVGKFDAYQRTYIIEPVDRTKLSTRFLYYVLRLQLEYMKSISTGAATKFLTKTILDNLEITIPEFETQRRIADILSAYDDLIENNTRRIRILEQTAQAIYAETLRATSVRDKESLPEGWESTTVENAFETLGGGTPSTKIPDYWEGGDINWYSPNNLTANNAMFIQSSAKQITKKGLNNSSAKMFPSYCVMMTSRATIGVVSINTTEACTNQGFITCIPNEKVSLYQIYFWILNSLEKINNVASGATFKEISRGNFRKFDFIIPDEKTKKKFDKIMLPIGRQIEILLAKNTNLRQTRDLLLPRLVSGEIAV